MKTLDLLATEENVYETFVNDSIGRNEDVVAFVSLLNSLEGSNTIALNARWGEGKTFFVKHVKMLLDALNPGTENVLHKEEIIKIWNNLIGKKEIEVQPFVTVYYDTWINDNDEDPVLSLVLSILKEIDGLTGLENERDLVQVAGNLLDYFTGKSAGEIARVLKGTNALEEIRKTKNLEQQIAQFLDSVLTERGNRMVVFIDELDRCKPDYAIRLLERVKHYFSNQRITFVFALNIDELQHTICKFYGNNFDACRYLDRFFEHRIELPTPDLTKFYYNIGLGRGSGLYENVCKIIVERFQMGLRETAKFYRIAKIAAYKPTHQNEISWSHLFNDGKGRRFCLYYIVPLMIGLNMCNRGRYINFIEGKDSALLYDIYKDTYIEKTMCSFLLNYGETYDSNEGKSEIKNVSRKEKLQEVYNAIFARDYDNRLEVVVGEVAFDGNTKNELLRIISGISDCADYEA